MGNLQLWEDKIKERRKQTKFRDFVREVSSWCPLVLGKTNGMVSRFPGTNRIKGVINKDHFSEQRDGLVESGRSYNPEESFTKNLREIFTTVDLPNLIHYVHNENSDFSDLTLNCKSIYLSNTVITGCENVLYSFSVKDNSANILNSVMVWNSSENVYMSTGIIKGFNIFYSSFVDNSNIWVLTGHHHQKR